MVGVRLKRFSNTLLSLHELTGCDTVCAFAGLAKTKAFTKMIRNIYYVDIFENFGEESYLDEEILELIEGFVFFSMAMIT